jgi:hypothetical protein
MCRALRAGKVCHRPMSPNGKTTRHFNGTGKLCPRLDRRRNREEGDGVEASIKKITDKLTGVQDKLNRLTRGYLDQLIDEESYRFAKADLVLEKTALKQEKQRLHRTGSSYWNEPTTFAQNRFIFFFGTLRFCPLIPR